MQFKQILNRFKIGIELFSIATIQPVKYDENWT